MPTLTLSSRFWRWLISFGVLAVGMVVSVVKWRDASGAADQAPWKALLVTCFIMALLLAFLEWITQTSEPNAVRKKFGWLSIGIGDDGFVSTSRVQAGLWTIGLAAAIAYLGFLVVFGARFENGAVVTADAVFSGGPEEDRDTDADWDNYLLLLGGPFAAAVLAKVSTTSKISDGDIQTSPGVAATEQVQTQAGDTIHREPSAGDLLTDNAGDLRLADTQYVIFNVVVFGYVAAAFVSKAVAENYGLPGVPATLLALTSVSAAGYVAAKATEKDRPGISTASYTSDTGVVTITGVNLRAASSTDDAARSGTRVIATWSDGGSLTVTPTSVSRTVVAARIGPNRVPPFQVRVLTSGGVATDDYEVTGA
jgi:hypothetical protein